MKSIFYKPNGELIIFESSEIWENSLKEILTSEMLHGTYKIVIEDIPTIPVIWMKGM